MDLALYMTHQCNLACTNCRHGRRFDRFMMPEIANDGIAMALSSDEDSCHVTFTGGEPLLMFDYVTELVEQIEGEARQVGKTVSFSLDTNGLLLDRRRMAFFKRHDVAVTIAIDGEGWSHDVTRRGGADGDQDTWHLVHERLEEAIDFLGTVATRTTVHPRNVKDLPATFIYLYELGVQSIDVAFDVKATWTEDDLDALDGAMARLMGLYSSAVEGDPTLAVPFIDEAISALVAGSAGADVPPRVVLTPKGNFYAREDLVGEDLEDTFVIGDVDRGLDDDTVSVLSRRRRRKETPCQTCASLVSCRGHHGLPQDERPRPVTDAACRLEHIKAAHVQAFVRGLEREAESPVAAKHGIGSTRRAAM